MKRKKKKQPSQKQIKTRVDKMLERMEAYQLTGKRPIGCKPPGAKK